MRRFYACSLALALAACSAGGSIVPNAPSSSQALHRSIGHLVFRVHVPKRKKHRRAGAHFISPSTKGMSIAITGPTNVTQVLGLTPSSPGCSSSPSGTTCTKTFTLAPCPTSSHCYGGSIATYDDVSCATSCTIPGGANELSANQSVSFSIAAGSSKAVGVTLDGIPASVTLVPGEGSTLTGSGSAFTVSKCVTTDQAVSVDGTDVDGNLIVGPGAPAATLSSDDTTHLAVATPAPNASPNAFKLVPPASLVPATIPKANKVVHFTAGVTPLAGTGSTTPVSSQIDVTFNSDVCGVITEFSSGITRGARPFGIVSGADGNLWFTECGTSSVGRITTSGSVTEFSTGITSGSNPQGIAAGNDGNLWFTEQGVSRIGRITTGGTVTEFSSGITSSSNPVGIAAGSDGNLWFTQSVAGVGQIGRITTGGTVTEFPAGGTVSPFGIAAGPDGNLWFADNCSTQFGSITTGGTISVFPSDPAGDPVAFAAGPDGNLWFTAGGTGIGQTTTDGTITYFPYVTTFSTAGSPQNITVGPDGNLWFTECSGDRIGRITTGGRVTEFSTGITSGSRVWSITTGPDGNLWFTQIEDQIGRIQ